MCQTLTMKIADLEESVGNKETMDNGPNPDVIMAMVALHVLPLIVLNPFALILSVKRPALNPFVLNPYVLNLNVEIAVSLNLSHTESSIAHQTY